MVINMQKINLKEMLRLAHKLSQHNYCVTLRQEGDYDVYIVPTNKEYSPDRNEKMFEEIIKYYSDLGYDVMIDETLMCYHLYVKN